MVRIRRREATVFGIGSLAQFVVRTPSRQERRKALREAIYRDYELAGNDPEFIAEQAEIEEAFKWTLLDGLEDPEDAYVRSGLMQVAQRVPGLSGRGRAVQ